jgi:hypothetical protein
MASLLVMVPIFVIIIRFINRDIAKEAARANLWVRKWALILTLFIAGLSMAIDLIVLLQRFFSGELLTVAFTIKVIIVLLVAALAFMHFIADYWGFWHQKENEGKSSMIGYAIGILALACVGAGFVIIGTPQHARMVRYDSQKISDLGNLQWQVVNYWQSKHKLPATLSDLNDPISQQVVPHDPQTNALYEYSIKAPLSFELCADFNAESDMIPTQDGSSGVVPISMPYKGSNSDNWMHGAGHTCFVRTIDPQLYPPIDNVKIPSSTQAIPL